MQWREQKNRNRLRAPMPRTPQESRSVLLFQMIDVGTVLFSEGRAFDEQNVLRVELGAPGKIVGTRDHGVVDNENFVVHVIMAPGRAVGGRVFPDQPSPGND